MTQQIITILGGGHMGGAMAQRWHAAGISVTVVERNPARVAALRAAGLHVEDSLKNAPMQSALVIAIKPQQFPEMKDALKNFASTRCVVSVMAGVTLAALAEISPRVVRVMPNLPAALGEGMSVCVASPAVSDEERAAITRLMEAVGRVAWLADEGQMHAATALSGCGPGYLFAFMDALERAGAEQGLPPELTRMLVRQTMRGAALLANQSTESVAQLAKNVASPGGVTQAALDVFSARGLEALVADAVDAAVKKSEKLAN